MQKVVVRMVDGHEREVNGVRSQSYDRGGGEISVKIVTESMYIKAWRAILINYEQ